MNVKSTFYKLSLQQLTDSWYTASLTHTTGQRFTTSSSVQNLLTINPNSPIDMAKKVDDKNTKKEILDAYAELAKEVQSLNSEKRSLESKLSAAAKSGASTPPPPPSTPASNAPAAPASGGGNNNPNVPAIKTYNVEDIIRIFDHIREGFGTAVSELSGKLTRESSKLADIQKQSREIENHIKELHGIDQLQDETLSTLIEDYTEKAKIFTREINEKKETLDKAWNEKQRNWHREQEAHSLRLADRDELQRRERKRDNDEYRYKLDFERKLSGEEHTQKKKKWHAELDELRQQKNKEWEEKEKEIATREKEYAEAKAKAEEQPEKLEKELKKVREETKGAIKRDSEIKANLLAKEIEGQKRLNELQVKTLEDNIDRQNAQIAALRKQLTETLTQAKELAIKAIEGASGAKSFDAMREIALEQAKQQKSK